MPGGTDDGAEREPLPGLARPELARVPAVRRPPGGLHLERRDQSGNDDSGKQSHDERLEPDRVADELGARQMGGRASASEAHA